MAAYLRHRPDESRAKDAASLGLADLTLLESPDRATVGRDALRDPLKTWVGQPPPTKPSAQPKLQHFPMKPTPPNRAARLLAGLLLVAASALDLRAQVPVRTDGAYYLVHPRGEKNDKGEPLCLAVRFYDDKTAIESEFFGDPAGLAKWFHRDNEDLHPGRWAMTGDELTVTVSLAFRETSRTGRMTAEGWRINERILFGFVPLSFPKGSATAGKNHRPYFTGYGNRIKKLDYDAAGRPTGLNEEIEIAAVDPDGDPLTYTWKVSSGTLIGDGAKVLWKRVITGESRPGTLNFEPGVISVEVSDGKGGKVIASQ